MSYSPLKEWSLRGLNSRLQTIWKQFCCINEKIDTLGSEEILYSSAPLSGSAGDFKMGLDTSTNNVYIKDGDGNWLLFSSGGGGAFYPADEMVIGNDGSGTTYPSITASEGQITLKTAGVPNTTIFSRGYFSAARGGIYSTAGDDIIADYDEDAGIFRYANGAIEYSYSTEHTLFRFPITIQDGNQADGRILTCDADGNAYWADSSGGGGGAYIPLSGTVSGSPVTGTIVSSPALLDLENVNFTTDSSNAVMAQITTTDDGFSRLKFKSNDFLTRYDMAGVQAESATNYQSLSFSLGDTDNEILVFGSGENFKGFKGYSYYGANYTDNTYVQKKYIDDKFIPLAGTAVGKPVTSFIEFSGIDALPRGLQQTYDSTQGYFRFVAATPSLYSTGFGIHGEFSVGWTGVAVFDTNNTNSPGIVGSLYFGANYSDNAYVQKKYVDDKATALKPYKVYTALLTQSGTSAPVATVLENTLGETPTWVYNAVGQYSLTTTGNRFTANKTFILTQPGNDGDASTPRFMFNMIRSSNTQLDGGTMDMVAGTTSVNGVLNNTSIEIRVYN